MKDPVTGDQLTRGEWISWKIQGIIRNWTFLLLITLTTIIVWSLDNPTGLTWWNLCASYMALVIESVVGIAMFSQTRRDALVIREIRKISQRIEKIESRVLKDVEQIEERLPTPKEPITLRARRVRQAITQKDLP